MAYKLIDAAAKAKADAVKFQTFKAEDLSDYSAGLVEYQSKNTKYNSQVEMLRRYELPDDKMPELAEYARSEGIIFMSTPHTKQAVEVLNPIVPAFKIGSGDFANTPFLQKVAELGKPMIISTGMSTDEDISRVMKELKDYKNSIAMLHCTTEYPCPLENVNLNAMVRMQKEYDVVMGYSDHTKGLEVPVYAVSLGAKIIEKHFTLDKSMEGPDHKASLDPEELSEMVRLIRFVEKKRIDPLILGSSIKALTKNEMLTAKEVKKSIFAKSRINKGEIITEYNIVYKRPGTGISPEETKMVLGKRAINDIERGTMIRLEDIE